MAGEITIGRQVDKLAMNANSLSRRESSNSPGKGEYTKRETSHRIR
ncbi:MAG TPA: hypothetical protein VGD65_24115 [Chryseosolibacter sp.]